MMNESSGIQYELSSQPCLLPKKPGGYASRHAVDTPCPKCGHQGMILDGRVVAHVECPQCEVRYCVYRQFPPCVDGTPI